MMRVWAELWQRMRALLRADAEDAELREELAFHLEREAESNLARGLSPAEALRAAREKLGNLERYSEEVRDERGASVVRDFGRDVRYSLRGLRRAPLFTVMVILALGLGIGATTAVFGLIDRVLLRPLPGVRAPHELVLVHMQRDEYNHTGASFTTFQDLREATPAFSAFAGYAAISLQVAAPAGDATTLRGVVVVGDYFRTLGVRPWRGRFFSDAELSGAGDPFVIVLRAQVAERLFPAGDAVGGTMRANGHPFRVIGIVPEAFRGVERMVPDEAWVPPGAYLPLRHFTGKLTERRMGTFREFFGRLRPAATAEQAQQQLRAAIDRLIAAYPDDMDNYKRNRPTVFAHLGLRPDARVTIGKTLRLLFGVSLLVLLIACANVANLLVLRGVVRRGEAAVRRALGASASRLMQQHFAEGVLIALLGAAAGLLVALLLTRVLSAEGVVGPELAQRLSIDWRVLAFTSAIVFLVSIAFAAIPTLLTRRLDLVSTLRQVSRGDAGRLGFVRGSLVVVQLGASVALLVVSVLLARTIAALNAVQLGFDPDRVVAFGISEEEQGYDRTRRALLQQRLLAETALLPQVDVAAITASAPFSFASFGGRLGLPGSADAERIRANLHWVSEHFFRALGAKLLGGRPFTAAEAADSSARIEPATALRAD